MKLPNKTAGGSSVNNDQERVLKTAHMELSMQQKRPCLQRDLDPMQIRTPSQWIDTCICVLSTVACLSHIHTLRCVPACVQGVLMCCWAISKFTSCRPICNKNAGLGDTLTGKQDLSTSQVANRAGSRLDPALSSADGLLISGTSSKSAL